MVLQVQNDLLKPGMLLRLALLSLLWATSTRGQQQEQLQLELTASSPYAMVLQPIGDGGKVPLSGLQFLEEAIATTLFEEQPTDNIYVDLEAVIQQVDYFQDDSDEQLHDNVSSATTNTTLRLVKIRFFVLATVVADIDESSSVTPRLELNQLVKTVLVDSIIGKNRFLELLWSNNHTSLQDVNSVLVSPWSSAATTVPAPSNDSDNSPSASSDKRLTTVDIILIVASGLIFSGILYMIVQHHYDRGYIENQRVLAFNRRLDGGGDYDDDHATNRSHPSPSAGKHRDGSSSLHTLAPGSSHGATNTTLGEAISDEAPSTPSTMYSATDLQPQDLTTPERKTPRITNVGLTRPSSSSSTSGIMSSNSTTTSSNALLMMTPKALLTASSVDGASIQSLSESFDGQWFDANVMDTDDDIVIHTEMATPIIKGGSIGNEGNGSGDHIDGEKNNKDDEYNDDDCSSGASDSSETSDSTESSEDVFHVDVEAASTADKSKASSHASAAAISEWMKTIRVVDVRHHTHCNGQYHSSSDTKTSDMTHSSHGEALSSSVSSSPPRDNGGKMTSSIASLAQTSLDPSSLEHRSLEQSMASSNIVNEEATNMAVLCLEV
jgi:hypothetical protein